MRERRREEERVEREGREEGERKTAERERESRSVPKKNSTRALKMTRVKRGTDFCKDSEPKRVSVSLPNAPYCRGTRQTRW